MRRIIYFIYYLWVLLEPRDDTNIWSISLAWELATIANEDKRIDEQWRRIDGPEI